MSSSSVRFLTGFLSPSPSSTASSSLVPFTHRRRLKTSYSKSKPLCRCSLRFQERSASEASSNSENTRSEEELGNNRMQSAPPQQTSIDGEDEVSGIEVPRQKYIPISKSQLLDAIVLILLEGDGTGKDDGGGGADDFLRLSSCLDSILHAEHKRILEDMRADYALSHCGDQEGSVVGDDEAEIKMGLNYGLEELRKLLLGSYDKRLEQDFGVDSRLDTASRFQNAFVQLLYEAQFEELSAGDLKLASALNTDYLLTLPIYVDWKKASESKAIIFRRGYTAERQTGQLIVEKLDYLQSKLLQKIFFLISKPLEKVGIWINKILQNACETPEVQSWTKKLKLWMDNMSNNQKLYSLDDEKRESLWKVDQLSKSNLPIWLAAQRAAPRYEGLLSSIGPRGRLLRKIMTWTGFITPTPDTSSDVEIDEATSEPYARPIFLPRISLNDIWRPASLKACGNDMWKMLKTSVSILLSKSTLLEPAFQELIILYTKDTGQEDTTGDEKIPSLEIKIYETIPIPDIPVIFPHKKLSFRIIDTVRLDIASILGLLAYFINYKFENISSSPSAVLLDFVAITALILYASRVVLGYKQTRDRYQLLVNRTLYEKTLASGFGSVHFLLDASEQQQYKEAILAYAILLKSRKGEVSCSTSIGEQCEKFMYQAFKKKVKMPTDKAISTLRQLQEVLLHMPKRFRRPHAGNNFPTPTFIMSQELQVAVQMSSKDVGNTSEDLLTAESQAPVASQAINLEVETETGEIESATGKTKRKTWSKVWRNFKKVKRSIPGPSGVTIEEKAQCIFCNAELNADTKTNGTSGLKYHVDHCKQNPANVQKTILSYTAASESTHDDGVGVLKNWTFNQEAVRKAVAHMIITDELPFRFVERAGFQHFMSVACPLLSIPSRRTVGRDCYMLYDEEKLKLKAFLNKSAQRVCLTTDTWTSIQRIDYLCLTVHFIDDKWVLQKRILNFVRISSHRGEDIGIVIEKCLADWGIENVFTITVDDASSNNTAVAYLKKKLTHQNGCILAGRYLHMRCIAHIINLVVVDGLNSLKHSISRIRNAVRYVRQSPSRWEKFKECIAYEKIESKNSVCLDVRTRWNSTYKMLESAVKFEAAFDRLDHVDPFFRLEFGPRCKGKDVSVSDDNVDESDADYDDNQILDDDNIGIPSKADWENARTFLCFLRRFYTLTVRVSGSKYVTANTFFTEISDVLYLLQEWQQKEDNALADMAVKMKQKFDKYWGDMKKMNMNIYFAVVLDPRYKLEYLQWALSEINKSGNKQVEAIDLSEMVKIALYDMFNEYMKINNCVVGKRKEVAATSGLQLDVDGGVSDKEGSSKLEANESIDTDTEFDILGWWRMHSPRFPILSQMARDVLAVPISTVASESAFSTSGRILDAFRSSLTPCLVQALICTQDWIRGRSCTSQEHVCIEEDLAEIEKLDEELMNFSLNQEEISVN
ncbi:unnamed protein product [Rhodiola kirilowii]